MENVKETFMRGKDIKFTGLTVNGSMEGETRERAVQGRKVVGSLGNMIKERTVRMEVKKGLRDGIIVPTIMYA